MDEKPGSKKAKLKKGVKKIWTTYRYRIYTGTDGNQKLPGYHIPVPVPYFEYGNKNRDSIQYPDGQWYRKKGYRYEKKNI